jgi:hypothetical protein
MIIKLQVKLVLLLLVSVSVFVLWIQMHHSLLALFRIDPLPETRKMLDEERYSEAADYLEFFMNYDYVNKNPEAQSLYEEIENNRKKWIYQLNKLVEGLFTGTSDETIGQISGVATDFFLIGDIRDLTKQGINYVQEEEVDEVLIALASLGLLASAAQVVSGAGTVATGGAAAPSAVGATSVKSGLIVLKKARKLGGLPPWLSKTIIEAAKTAKQSRSLGALSDILGNISVLAKTRGGFKLMSQSKNAADLQRIAKFADTFGSQSSTIYRIGGKLAIDTAQKTEKYGKETIKLSATFGKEGLHVLNKVGAIKFTKVASRTSKMIYKGDILKLLAKFLLLFPTWFLYFIVFFGTVALIPHRLLAAFSKRVNANLKRIRVDISEKSNSSD